MVTPCGGMNRARCGDLFVSLTPIFGDPLIGVPIVMTLFFGGMDKKVMNLLVQFTLAPQSSQIRVCIVQHLLKRTWIGATLVDLIRLRA